ncbi:MAG TPA: hypothetical protein VK548_26880 [Candidatus Acidoferrum sp.]|nr:hypothetical protein [Candidatus Acidoferrum sp.]
MRLLTWPLWILCVALSAAVSVTPASAQLTITANQTVFHPGENVEVTVGLDNAGPGFFSDVYVGAQLPDGSTVLLTSLSPLAGAVVSLSGDPRSFPRLLTGFPVLEGSDLTILASLSFPFSGPLSRGDYGFFAALTGANALQDGRIDPGDLIAVAVQTLTFADLGTGLKTATIGISPSAPTPGDTLSIRLSGQWPDSCRPQNPQLRVTGTEIRIDTFGGAQGAVCAAVVTPWELTAPVSPRPAGTYRVVVVNSSQGQLLELAQTDLEIE